MLHRHPRRRSATHASDPHCRLREKSSARSIWCVFALRLTATRCRVASKWFVPRTCWRHLLPARTQRRQRTRPLTSALAESTTKMTTSSSTITVGIIKRQPRMSGTPKGRTNRENWHSTRPRHIPMWASGNPQGVGSRSGLKLRSLLEQLPFVGVNATNFSTLRSKPAQHCFAFVRHLQVRRFRCAAPRWTGSQMSSNCCLSRHQRTRRALTLSFTAFKLSVSNSKRHRGPSCATWN
mmetsp:Transcript_33252/g.102666  ORF Transcript_33252/g.102666 Transcript_33252/m.102666 type:complete len:237 (+) Transcript_33252:278-988(+)